MNIIDNKTGMPEEGDIRTYTNNQNQEVRQVYKCEHRIHGIGISILCGKNQHGCEALKKLDQSCNRKELVWMTKL